MKKIILKSALCLGFIFNMSAYAQDEGVTNPFLDLQRKGLFSEEQSPMRKTASLSQMKELMENAPSSGYYTFFEDRLNSVRVFDAVPISWLGENAEQRRTFEKDVTPGEIYVFQVGVLPANSDLKDLKLKFSSLKNGKGKSINSSDITCYNTGGIDVKGKPFTKQVDVLKGEIKPLWVGVKIPASAQGVYKGRISVSANGVKTTTLNVAFTAKGKSIENGGTNEGWRMSRLSWLNSVEGVDTKVTAPYVDITVSENRINYLGGSVEIGENGLPSAIITNYNAQNQLDKDVNVSLLSQAMDFIIETSAGVETFSKKSVTLKKVNEGRAEWKTTLKNSNFTINIGGFFEFDGFSDVTVDVIAKKDIQVKEIKLDIPYSNYSARYIMGLGLKGGLRKEPSFNWQWDTSKSQDAIWMGNVNSGMRIKFKGDNYRRQLVNVYYALGELNLPNSWGNDNKGGVRVEESDKEVLLTAYSGSRKMSKGEKLSYQIELLITPVKPLNMNHQAHDRYYHSNSDVSTNYIKDAKKAGANIINIHHKKDIYPFINYPYYDESLADLTTFISDAHKEDIKVKVYYTTRELTVKIPEIWAFRTLDNEVIMNGPGKDTKTLLHPNGPNKWLNDNLKSNFIPAWYNAFNDGKYKGDLDISVLTTPDSRWNNYYLAGVDWMIDNIGIDGIYIDDSALDRESLKRARRILDEDGKVRFIDIHSWNHMNEHARYANSLMLYAELMPYTDRLWMGEGFHSSNTSDFWLVEVSGIPFGLMSETLDNYNYWRGMCFGMTPRLGWSGNPAPMWTLMDDFGFDSSTMYGFWDENTPVTVDDKDVKVTTFLNGDKALVVIANWSNDTVSCKFQIDEEKLGFKPSKISAPIMKNVQHGSEITMDSVVEFEGQKGLFLILEK